VFFQDTAIFNRIQDFICDDYGSQIRVEDFSSKTIRAGLRSYGNDDDPYFWRQIIE